MAKIQKLFFIQKILFLQDGFTIGFDITLLIKILEWTTIPGMFIFTILQSEINNMVNFG